MIFVFKTSVDTKKKVRELEPQINRLLDRSKWNFDLEDCDKILRVDSDHQIVRKIIDLLILHSFSCEELA